MSAYRFGKHPPKQDYRTLRLKTYLTSALATWGSTQKGTWEWWDDCLDEAYAMLPPEAKESDFAPGFNFAQLQADLEAVANVD